MPARSPRRGARSTAAPLALVVATGMVLTGCSSSHQAAAPTTTPIGASSTPTSGTDTGATRLLAKAEATLSSDRSYRFSATETVAAKTPVTTSVSGAVVRGQGVAYSLVAGRATTQVVRIKGATYSRRVPGRWVRLAKPSAVSDPTASLAALLRGLDGLKTVDAVTVAGTLASAAAKSAGIPTGSEPAQVTVTVDAAGHVTRVTVHTATQAGNTVVAVTLVTSYSAFDRVPALRRPV